jgi:hypothetical protein
VSMDGQMTLLCKPSTALRIQTYAMYIRQCCGSNTIFLSGSNFLPSFGWGSQYNLFIRI